MADSPIAHPAENLNRRLADPDRSQPVRGLVRPRREASIASQIEGRVIALPFEEGERFARGDVIVRFDCAMHQARLAAAQAEHGGARKRHANNLELSALDAIGDLEVALSESEVAKAEAQERIARVQVERCVIRAPYAGRVVSNEVNEWESVQPSQELLRILDDERLEIELIVPSHWLTWLETGTSFDFRIDETGQKLPAKVQRIGAAADPVSQTVRVIAHLPEESRGVLSGMSGSAHFGPPAPAAPATAR